MKPRNAKWLENQAYYRECRHRKNQERRRAARAALATPQSAAAAGTL